MNTTRARLLAACLAGLLSMLSFYYSPLALVAFVPCVLCLYGVNARQGAVLGLCYGLALWVSSAWWQVLGLASITNLWPPMFWLASVLLYLLPALPYALFGAFAGFVQEHGVGMSWYRGALWLSVLVCWFPLVFPCHLGNMLYATPLLTQLADIGGVSFLFFIVLVVNWLVADIIRARHAGNSSWKKEVILACMLLVLLGYGWHRLHEHEHMLRNASSEDFISVTAVQPNVSVFFPGTRIHITTDEALPEMMIYARGVLEGASDKSVVVWPELPFRLECNDEEFITLSRTLGRSMVYQCMEPLSGGKGFYNTSVMLDDTGQATHRYYKRTLVPLGEYVPFENELPFLRWLFPNVSRYVPGTERVFFRLQNKKVLPLICYEVIFPGSVRENVGFGAGLLLNMVDDAWFESPMAARVHLAMALFRAIENRRPLVRVTNSGYGAHVRASGEIVPGTLTAPNERVVRSAALYVPKVTSIYSAYGGKLSWLVLAALLLDILLIVRCFRRMKQ